MSSIEIIHESGPVPEEDRGWKTTADNIKFKERAGTDSHRYRIYRVLNASQLNEIETVPGTVAVIENSREIKYIDGESGLCSWGGNSARAGRWAGRTLLWDGADLHWACQSTVSIRIRDSSFDAVNRLNATDIVLKIISETGLVKQRSKRALQRFEKIPDTSEAEDLRRCIDDLQALIEKQDLAFARLENSLKMANEENLALRAQLQAVTGILFHPFDTLIRPPSSLASAVPDGPTMCLGDVLYAPPCGGSDQAPPRDQPVSLLQYPQLQHHLQGAGDGWSTGGLPQHPTFINASSSLSGALIEAHAEYLNNTNSL